MRHRRAVSIGLVVLSALLLMGCSLFSGGDTKESREAELAMAEGESKLAAQKAADKAAGKTLPEELDISGSWIGTLTFDDYTMLLEDEEAAEAWRPGIASTMDKPYTISISIRKKPDGTAEATLTLDDETVIDGTVARDETRVDLLFKKAGDTNFEVGASPPVTFALEGFIESQPSSKMSGTVRYDVFAKDGPKAWSQTGSWVVTR